jgi:hypothetical protein
MEPPIRIERMTCSLQVRGWRFHLPSPACEILPVALFPRL